MKRSIIVFLLVFLIVGLLWSGVVMNPDKPLKGEWDFKARKVWQIEGYNDELLAMVQHFAVHDNGDIYLFDRKHFKFFVFDNQGKAKFTFGKLGEGPGEIKIMLGFFLVGDKVVVSDMGKIHYFGLDGKYIKSNPTSSTVGIAPLLFIDENRLVKIRLSFDLAAGPEALEIFNLAEGSTHYLAGEPVPAADKNVDRGTRVMISIGSAGNERRTTFVAGKIPNTLLWGKNDTYLVKGCDFSGKEQFSFSIEGRKLKKITQKNKEQIVARMNIRSTNDPSGEEMKKRLISRMPDECTYFSRIEAGPKGLIYVYVSDVAREKGREIDIFSPNGEYLYHADIDFPEVTRIVANGIAFKGDSLYAVVEEESGDFSFRKYGINTPPAPPVKK